MEEYTDIHENIHFWNTYLDRYFKKIIIFYISDNFDFNLHSKLKENIQNSIFITVEICKQLNKDTNDDFFLIGFEKTILIIKQSYLSVLKKLLSFNSDLKICFLSNIQDVFNQNIQINYKKIDSYPDFNDVFYEIVHHQIFKLKSNYRLNDDIIRVFFHYLINKSYIKSNEDRIKDFLTKSENIKLQIIKNDDYLNLIILGTGSTFKAQLIYHINNEELYVIKIPNVITETSKLTEREITNYSQIKYPFLPKFIGLTEEEKDAKVIIEYINGSTLFDFNLNDQDKINIIFEIMLTIDFFHKNKYIYRDLKPNNIMIDHNKTAVLIDFDRMISHDYATNNTNHTNDFASVFAAPEVNSEKFSYSCDIYSLGMIIFYIMIGKIPYSNIYDEIKKYKEISKIFYKCIEQNPDKRPNISELVDQYYEIFHSQIQNEDLLFLYKKSVYQRNNSKLSDEMIRLHLRADDLNDSDAQFRLGVIYEEGKKAPHDIKKSIYYLDLASKQNNLKAQLNLVSIYFSGVDVPKNINKAIHYFTLAANQNDPDAQLSLGIIYYSGIYVPRDINKAIHYLSLASDNNICKAQYILGTIFLKSNLVPLDINKAIHYFTLASNQNNPASQFFLGTIYLDDKFVPRDINKAIHYFTLSSNAKYIYSQVYLGMIYYDGKYINRDINKSIQYYTLAANQGSVLAQLNLANIFENGQYIKKDINKAIHFYTLAANQNHPVAQFNLGFFYQNGLYLKQDINKAIYFYTLAANQNNAHAQYNLALIYHSHDYFVYDINKAIYYYSLAVNQNHIRAALILGNIFYKGVEITKDIKKAIYYFQIAANQNDTEAIFILGLIYIENKEIPRDIQKAIYYFKNAASKNHIQSQINLSVIYSDNKYVQCDISQTIYYLSLAANQNHIEALLALGDIFYLGSNTPVDINKAIHYYSLAAKQNDAQAEYNLGLIYKNRNDIKKAIYYFELAACHNFDKAQYMLGIIYLEGEITKKNTKKAIHYLILSANQKYANSLYALGEIYEKGEVVPRDIKKAIHYYSSAADKNEPISQYILGIYFLEGFHVIKNIKKSFDLLILSSQNGYIQATFTIGFLYHEGIFLKKDILESVKYYKEASSFNNYFAKNNLGIIYKNGFGDKITKNISYSIDLFKEAIKLNNNDTISMYNLANIFFYNENIRISDEDLIELLLKSSNKDFEPSQELFCLFFVKKFQFNLQCIITEIQKLNNLSIQIKNKMVVMIINHNLCNQTNYHEKYREYQNIDFVYDHLTKIIQTSQMYNQKNEKDNKIPDISSEFYKGFELDI